MLIRTLAKILLVICLAAGLFVAWQAEMPDSAARLAVLVAGCAVLLISLQRADTPRFWEPLPWLALALTWFLPFLPGAPLPYPATRFLLILCLAASGSCAAWLPQRLGAWSFIAWFLVIGLDWIRAWNICQRLSYGYDLAHVLNLLWNTSQGRFLYSDYLDVSLLGHHLYLTLAALAPLYAMDGTPFLPQALQIGLMAASVWLLALAARERYGSGAAGAAFAFCLLHPAFQGQILHEFDPGVIGLFGSSLALFGYANERNRYYYAGLALALLSKEHFAAGWAVAGALFLFRQRTRRRGFFTLALALAVGGAFLWYACHCGEAFALQEQTRLRFGPGLHDPRQFLAEILQLNKIGYWLHMFIPSGFLALFGWEWLLPALPEMLINVSARFPMYQLTSHYATLTLPFLTMGVARGVSRLVAWTNDGARRSVRFAIIAAVGAALFSNIHPFSATGAFYDVILRPEVPAEVVEARELIARLPPGDVAVRGQYRLLLLLPERKPVIDLPYVDTRRRMASRPILILDHAEDTVPPGYRCYDHADGILVCVRDTAPVP